MNERSDKSPVESDITTANFETVIDKSNGLPGERAMAMEPIEDDSKSAKSFVDKRKRH